MMNFYESFFHQIHKHRHQKETIFNDNVFFFKYPFLTSLSLSLFICLFDGKKNIIDTIEIIFTNVFHSIFRSGLI